MDKKIVTLLKKARSFVAKYGLEGVNWERLNEEGISIKEMVEEFKTPEELVNNILVHERVSFEKIFDEFDFEGWNAIDILLLVSKEINERFFDITPSITMEFKELFPEIYKKHIAEREKFIFDKMTVNIEKGISQGMYRNDISSEMIARMFISKLDDIHNPELYPPESFSFSTIFENLINYFIKSIATEEGKNYYKERKQLYDVLGFGK